MAIQSASNFFTNQYHRAEETVETLRGLETRQKIICMCVIGAVARVALGLSSFYLGLTINEGNDFCAFFLTGSLVMWIFEENDDMFRYVHQINTLASIAILPITFMFSFSSLQTIGMILISDSLIITLNHWLNPDCFTRRLDRQM